MGVILGNHLNALKSQYPQLISNVRGRGLLHAIEFTESSAANGKTAWDFCLMLRDAGVLAKPTHDVSIRLAPPLTITEFQINKVAKIMQETMEKFSAIKKGPGAKAKK